MSWFDTHGGDSRLNYRSGQHITVVDLCDPCKYDYEEIGWMYRVRFDDGFEIDAFEDEIRGDKPSAVDVFDGDRCPRCGEAADIEYGRAWADNGLAWHSVECKRCGFRYVLEYEFKTVDWEEA